MAFGAGYLDVYPHRDLGAARAEVRGLVRGGLTGRVADLGCGWGRHVLAMLEEGLDAVGLDLSAELLARATAIAEGRLAGRVVRGDLRRLPFRAASLDGATLLFSSFGYFDEAQNARVLAEAGRCLRPGGQLVLDLADPDHVRGTLVAESESERGGWRIRERRRLTGAGKRVRKDVQRVAPDGSGRSWHEDLRLYDAEELRPLLAERGMALERVLGDFGGGPPAAGSPRRILWARRR